MSESHARIWAGDVTEARPALKLGTLTPQPGECLADNSTLGNAQRLLQQGMLDGFSLLNLNQLCKEFVLYERVWTLNPSDDVLSGLDALVPFLSFIQETDLRQTYISAIGQARSTTRDDASNNEIKALWSRVLRQDVRDISEDDIDDFYDSPVYYENREYTPHELPSIQEMCSLNTNPAIDVYNPNPLSAPIGGGPRLRPARIFAVAASFRSNLYLALGEALGLTYVPDVIRTEYVAAKLEEDIRQALGPNLTGIDEISTAVRKRFNLDRRRARSRGHAEGLPFLTLEFPFFLFYVLEKADKPADVLSVIVELRGSGRAKRLRRAIRQVEAGGSQLKAYSELREAVSELEFEWAPKWRRAAKRALSIVSLRPLPFFVYFLSPDEWMKIASAVAGSVSLGELALTQIKEGIDWLRKRSRFALLEHLALRTSRWGGSDPRAYLANRVEHIWKARLLRRDLEFMADAAPLSFVPKAEK